MVVFKKWYPAINPFEFFDFLGFGQCFKELGNVVGVTARSAGFSFFFVFPRLFQFDGTERILGSILHGSTSFRDSRQASRELESWG